MSLKKTAQLPKSDGTTSTNYGPDFEVLTPALFMLNLCKIGKTFQLWINRAEYTPWDDIFAEIDDGVICVQLKHNEKLDKEKMTTCLNARESVLKKDSVSNKEVKFVYYTTSPPDSSFETNCIKINKMPDLLNLLVTNRDNLYSEIHRFKEDTFFCMQQHNVAQLKLDLKQALENFIGKNLLSRDHLSLVQTKLLDYLKDRYQKHLKPDEPFTNEEIATQLAFCILDKYKVEYKGPDSKVTVLNDLHTILEQSSVVVINHKLKSDFKQQIWQHLIKSLSETIPKKQLKQTKFDTLWMEGMLHMPLVSPNVNSDRIILRALQIANFKPKVLILRAKTFKIKEKQHVIIILQHLNKISDAQIETRTRIEPQKKSAVETVENFAYAPVELEFLINNKKMILHQDAFAKVAASFLESSRCSTLKMFVEAHDEVSFVNDKDQAALFSAIKVNNVELEIIKHIIRLGGNVNAVTENDFTPIFFAVEANRLDILNLLLENGADPNPSNKFGDKALFRAVMNNQLEIMKLLIKHGARRFDCDKDGVSPLFMAYRNHNLEAMKILLAGYTRAHDADVQGSHILHRAAEENQIEILKCVIENCLSVGSFINGDRLGKNPLEISKEKKHNEFLEILQKALKE